MFRSTFALAAIAGIAAAQQGYAYGASTTSSSTSTIPTGVPDAETCNCYLKLNTCQTGPDANQSYCASQFASCVGYSPYSGGEATTAYFNNLNKYCYTAPSSSVTAPQYSTAPTATQSPSPSTCDCYEKLGQCQVAPDANQSFCASQFASCAQTDIYTKDSATVQAYFDNLKKTCTPTSSSSPPSYSTPAPSTTASGPPSAETCACYTKLGQCQTAPNANQAYCASQFAGCINYNPYTGDSAAVQAFFDNLKKNCPASSTTSESAPPAYTSASTSASAPPVYSTLSTAHPSNGNATLPTSTHSQPALYTGAAAPAKVAAPVVAAVAFGAFFL